MEELVQPEEAVPIKQTKKTNIALGKSPRSLSGSRGQFFA